jgi:tetratricopeptide (TPR) repeat protein
MAATCVLVLVALAGWARAQQAAGAGRPGLARFPADQAEVARLSPKFPHVVELVERGEAEALGGNLVQALALFKQAAAEYPYSGLVARRECEALTALGWRDQAIKACREAMQYSPIPLNVRASVRALLSGPGQPSAMSLAQAMQLAGNERRQRPGEPWGYAALCDVGERLGDEAMLMHCSEELLKLAPNDPTTRRVLAELRPRWWVGAGWLVIAMAALATLAHALWRAVTRPRRRAAQAAVVGLIVCVGAFGARLAHAQSEPAMSAQPAASAPLPPPRKNPDDLSSEWTVNDDAPDSNIPGEAARNRNPLEFGYWLQDVTARGLKAAEHGDHEAAIKYFRALAKAVPDRAVSFSKLCAEYAALGKRNEAILTCSTALTRAGVLVSDYARFVHVVLDKPEQLTTEEVTALKDVVRHVREDPNGGNAAAAQLECDIGVKTRDAAKLDQCIKELAAANPKDPRTLTYEWALAMVRGHYDEAKKILERVKRTKMKPEGLEAMERETERDRLRHRKTEFLFGGGALVLLVGATFVVVTTRRRRSGPLPAPASQMS